MPDSGWTFVGWSGDTTDTTNPLQLIVNRNLSVVATFRDTIPPAVSVVYPNGKSQSLIEIADWDPSWQSAYYFQKPIPLPSNVS